MTDTLTRLPADHYKDLVSANGSVPAHLAPRADERVMACQATTPDEILVAFKSPVSTRLVTLKRESGLPWRVAQVNELRAPVTFWSRNGGASAGDASHFDRDVMSRRAEFASYNLSAFPNDIADGIRTYVKTGDRLALVGIL
jgi:hypothetical protein